jgi:O-antigen ligase
MKSKSLVINIFLAGILLSSFIFSPLILDFVLTPRLILISICVAICLFLIAQSKQISLVKIDSIILSYFGFVLFSCISSFWANTLSESIFENSKLIISFFVFLISYYCFKKDKDYFLNALIKLAILIVAIEFLLVLYQLSFLKSFNKEELYQIYGANSHKNLLSSFLFINLFFLVLGIARMKKIWKYLSIICVILNLAIIALLQTKAVWIALVLSGVLIVLLIFYQRIKWNFNLKWVIIIAVIVISVFFVFIQPQIIKKGLAYNEITAIESNNANKKELDNERLQLWDKTYYMIKQHPLLGVGMGNWQIHFPDATLKGMYRAEDLNYTFQRPHNDLLWIIAETGFIGFNLFLIFIISLLAFLLKTTKIMSTKKSNYLESLLCIIFIIGFYTTAFFDFPKERIEHLIWINIIFSFAYYLIKENNELKFLSSFKVKNLHYAAIISMTVITTIIGIYRYKGEFYTRKMYDQKKIANNAGVLQQGRKALNFAYSIDPTSLPIKWYTGNSYAVLGNFEQAKVDLISAKNKNPYNRNVLNDLASAYVNTNQKDSAIYYYLEASRISPRFDDSKLNLVTIYFNQKQFEKADSCLKTLLHDSERRTKYQKMVNAFLKK